MRRNTLRMLKYLLVAGVCLMFGPMLFRFLLGRNHGNALDDDGFPDEDHVMERAGQALPEAPELVFRRNHKLTVS